MLHREIWYLQLLLELITGDQLVLFFFLLCGVCLSHEGEFLFGCLLVFEGFRDLLELEQVLALIGGGGKAGGVDGGVGTVERRG